ncbi:leucine-rich repeat-containing protein 74A-like [Pomacea canaliculata]|nr:leucine-rich repeat-containing protein 74A-like [Pomacea canaliculata]
MIGTNKTLRVLDISENGFVDADAVCLARAVENHSRLTVLNLSHNAFGDPSAACFSHMIAENGVLEDLNLSWNHFRVKGAQELGDGLAENESLKSFNMSWNGAEDKGTEAVGMALNQNSTLQHIDLTSNRISSKGFLTLLKALPHNEALRSIRVGRNNISTEGAKVAVAFLKTIRNLALHLLDLSDIILNSSIKPLLEELKQMHPDLQISYGYTDSYGKHKMRSYDMVAEALSTMQSFCQENKIQLVEMFARFDADGSTSLTREEFNEGLKEAKIPLTTQHVDKLIEELDKDGDKEIDFSELVIGAGQKSERKAKKLTMKL